MIGLERVNEVFDMVELAWADQGFGGEPLRSWMKQEFGWDLELTSGISKPEKPDFEVAPHRWLLNEQSLGYAGIGDCCVILSGWW
jgi:hypothetical protein